MKLSRLIVTLLCAVTVLAQTDELKRKTKGFKNSRRFSVKYDKVKDLTTITAGDPAFGSGSKAGGGISAVASFKGDKPEGEVSYFFVFDSWSSDWLFLDESSRVLYTLIDGERRRFDPGERFGDIDKGFAAALSRSVRIKERLAVKLDEEILRPFISSKGVEMKAGGYEFKLKEEHHAFDTKEQKPWKVYMVPAIAKIKEEAVVIAAEKLPGNGEPLLLSFAVNGSKNGGEESEHTERSRVK